MVWLIKHTDIGWKVIETYTSAKDAFNDKESLERSARKAGFKIPNYKVVGELA